MSIHRSVHTATLRSRLRGIPAIEYLVLGAVPNLTHLSAALVEPPLQEVLLLESLLGHRVVDNGRRLVA